MVVPGKVFVKPSVFVEIWFVVPKGILHNCLICQTPCGHIFWSVTRKNPNAFDCWIHWFPSREAQYPFSIYWTTAQKKGNVFWRKGFGSRSVGGPILAAAGSKLKNRYFGPAFRKEKTADKSNSLLPYSNEGQRRSYLTTKTNYIG